VTGPRIIPLSPPKHRISSRQAEILDLLAEGGSSKTIGGKLGISPRTVDSHIRTILLKLGAASRTHAVGLWLQNWRER
jgi:DNA-binding CsgD family transcriptional regulator